MSGHVLPVNGSFSINSVVVCCLGKIGIGQGSHPPTNLSIIHFVILVFSLIFLENLCHNSSIF